MTTYGEFQRQTQAMARAVRKLPKEIRKDLAKEVKEKIAVPIADEINRQAHGPYGRALSTAAKARLDAQPVIVVGGTRPLVSGGATGRQLVFGNEFGGGSRVSTVNRKPGKRGRVSRAERASGVYKRHSTKQFSNPHPHVYPTVEAMADDALEMFADLIVEKIDNALPR